MKFIKIATISFLAGNAAMVSSTKTTKSGKKECYFDAVTESYIKGSADNPVDRDGNQYFWGVNAVCKDPTFVYDPNVKGTASYCNDKNADEQYPNAVQVGSARGHCFVAPTQFGDNECQQEGLYGCEWNCEEVLVVNEDYLFLKYLYQDDDSSVMGDSLEYPREFKVIVTGGTGCYQNVDNAIIPGYTEYSDTYYYTYDLSPLKKK
ncbi:hypothetical protein QTG54_006539 [Skeletonema marinoi]|uniref:Secreted protein n=1 Tax=Skeletonema marinoi TaxID=267567 RepID=A0AAD8YCI0_9STRA|nr:hypothetical protein QTG54_006539 [Skeletonema marinoi]